MKDPVFHATSVKVVPLSELNPHPKNPNVHTDSQIERLAEIMKYQGVRKPITVSTRSGFITSGHGRMMAAKFNGWTEFPVSFQDYESDEQEYADLVADNAIAEWATIDLSMVNLEVPNLGPEMNIEALGLKKFNLNFEPGDENNQSKLDEKQFVFMECPHCGDKFEKGQARVLKD